MNKPNEQSIDWDKWLLIANDSIFRCIIPDTKQSEEVHDIQKDKSRSLIGKEDVGNNSAVSDKKDRTNRSNVSRLKMPGYSSRNPKLAPKWHQPSFCTTREEGLFKPIIELFDLTNPRLQYIFNKEVEELSKSFAALKMTIEAQDFQHEVMLCFWFAIHRESLLEAQLMCTLDPVIESIIKSLRENGSEVLAAKLAQGQGQKNHLSMISGQDNSQINQSQEIIDEGEGAQRKGRDALLETIEDLEDLKYLLKEDKSKVEERYNDVGVPFNTNILRICLNYREEKMAQVLAAYYSIAMDSKMMLRAIKTKQMNFLYCIFAFNKNYEYIGQDPDSDGNSDDENVDDDEDDSKTYHLFTYDWLIKQIMKYSEEDTSQRIKQLADWKLQSTENFLKSMLINRQDIVAAQFGHQYQKDADISLLKFAFYNSNEQFLKYAFRNAVFSGQMLYDREMIDQTMKLLQQADQNELVLNVLIFADFGRWQQSDLRVFIDWIGEIVDSQEQNLMFKCYNPILVICLCCEFLAKIGNAISLFKHEGHNLSIELQNFGEKLIQYMPEEFIEKIFMDTDFLDRTVLKHITDFKYAPLLKDDKVSALLDQLWIGKNSYECDGRITDFSMLTFLASSPIKKLPGKKIEPTALLSNNFKVNINEENFQFQYKFRKSAISFIFQKELASTIFLAVFLMIINYYYITNFYIANFQAQQDLIASVQALFANDTYWIGDGIVDADSAEAVHEKCARRNQCLLKTGVPDCVEEVDNSEFQRTKKGLPQLTPDQLEYFNQWRNPLNQTLRTGKIFDPKVSTDATQDYVPIPGITPCIPYTNTATYQYLNLSYYPVNVTNMSNSVRFETFWNATWNRSDPTLANFTFPQFAVMANTNPNETGQNNGSGPFPVYVPFKFTSASRAWSDQLVFVEQFTLNSMVQDNIDNYQTWNMGGIIASCAMMFYVLTKIIFNLFATIKLPVDKWSLVDIFCAFTNIACFMTLSQISVDVVLNLDGSSKRIFNVLMNLNVITSWLRFFNLLFVVESVSIILMTMLDMLSNAGTFLIIDLFYLSMMSTVFFFLFSESTINFANIFYTVRTIIDAQLGMYAFATPDKYMPVFSVLLDMHVFIGNTFLLNYLIAILSTVYEQSMEKGDFAYKCNKYQYIERYHIAFQDEWGYTELLIHPPPVNVTLVVLFPCLLFPNTMLRFSQAFSYSMFWAENLFFIAYQLIYEITLVPYIYLKVFYNVISLAGIQGLHLIIGWMLFGLFFLMYGVSLDMFYFIKILCDSKQDDEIQVKMFEEDDKQDRVVIYNEIINVLQSLLFIVQQKESSKLNKKGKIFKGLSPDMELDEALQKQNELAFESLVEEEIIEGLTLEKKIIMDAWARYRPVQKLNKKRPKAKTIRDLKIVYSEDFINYIIANTRLKVYDYQETETQKKRKKTFKNDFTRIYKERVQEKDKDANRGVDYKQEEDPQKGIPEEEIAIIDKFLSGFILNSDSAKKIDQIDIPLALKALPSKVDDENVYRCNIFDFEATRKALIAFQNDDQDELFKHYDNRNKTRLTKLGGKAGITKDLTAQLKELGSSVLSIVKKIADNGKQKGYKQSLKKDIDMDLDDLMLKR